MQAILALAWLHVPPLSVPPSYGENKNFHEEANHA